MGEKSNISHNVKKKIKILEICGDIQNQHEKCIEISTNMPSIGLKNSEIACEISRKSNSLCMVKPMIAC